MKLHHGGAWPCSIIGPMKNLIDHPLYEQHLQKLEIRWQQALEANRFDAAVILAGTGSPYFLDDQAAPFRPNPHFAQWFPQRDCADSALLIRPGTKATLLFYSPQDYWHQPAPLPDWSSAFNVQTFDSEAALQEALADHLTRTPHTAVIGDQSSTQNLAGSYNPPGLLNHLHYYRAWKSPFELEAMRQASSLAARGHNAAARCFADGGSEFQIHLAYLGAAGQIPEELPYSSIVAINEHAGVLHYQHYDRALPIEARSFLIDAGATAHGYAADVTRSYAATGESLYHSLIEALDEAQLALIADIRPGQAYLNLHKTMHLQISRILADHQLITCSPEAAVSNGVSQAFLPHGLGHLIGLQTHDVGGQQLNPSGEQAPPPAEYPALRMTRELSPDMVFTIEPGIYFIPMLLDELRAGSAAEDVNWPVLETLLGCGGIRIEDNIVVTDGEPENLTRDAFAELASKSG